MSETLASLIHQPGTIVERFDLAQLFPQQQPLEVELGSGDGSFLVQYAALHPDRNFIGVERLLGRLRKIDRKGRRLGLANVRVVRIEASYFLQYLLPKNSATAIHIYFPDPWPKRKHHKHRLINSSFPEIARAALVPHGVVYLRTDNPEYFTQMKTVFGAAKYFREIPTPDSLTATVTDFERQFTKQGIQTKRASYQVEHPS